MSHEPIGQHRNIDLAASERRSPNCLRHWRLRADRTNGYALVRIAIRHGNALLSAEVDIQPGEEGGTCDLPGRRRAAQDEGGETFRFAFFGCVVGAPAEDQLDEPQVYVGCQEADEAVPGWRVLVAEQHVRELVNGDMGGVEGVVSASW